MREIQIHQLSHNLAPELGTTQMDEVTCIIGNSSPVVNLAGYKNFMAGVGEVI